MLFILSCNGSWWIITLLTVQKQPPEVFCKKKVFLEISKNSQENTCARGSFLIKMQVWGMQLY